MEELIANPAVQAGVAPFLVALVVALALMRTRLAGLALVAAFATVLGLAIGFSIEPLTATRKLMLIGLVAALPVTALELSRRAPTRAVRAALAAAAGAAVIWMVWRVLQQQEMAQALLRAAAAAAFIAMLFESGLRIADDAVRASAAAMVLGLAAGALALLGASALFAQVGIAAGAGAGAVLLVSLVAGPSAGWTLMIPAVLVPACVAILAVLTGSLRWYAVLPLLAVPWAVRIVPRSIRSLWLVAVLATLAALVPAAVAIGIAWATTGDAS